MPLTMRPTGGHSPVYADRQDWTIFDAGAPVGRIYEDAFASTPEDMRWFWSIVVYVHPRVGIVKYQRVRSIRDAVQLRTSLGRGWDWAELLHAHDCGWRTHLQRCVHNYSWLGGRIEYSIWRPGTCTRSHCRRRPSGPATRKSRLARLAATRAQAIAEDLIRRSRLFARLFSSRLRRRVRWCRCAKTLGPDVPSTDSTGLAGDLRAFT
jgi:hypothetical protein